MLEAALALVTDGAWYSGVMTTCKVHGVASGLLAVHNQHALHACLGGALEADSKAFLHVYKTLRQ